MLLFDFVCSDCSTIAESIVDRDVETIPCPECGADMHKFFGNSAGKRLPDTAEWINSIRDVVDKESTKPHVQAFMKSPTRENLRILMQKEGIRHMEPGEERRREPEFDEDRMAARLLRQKMERERIEV
jgi:predicted nucleic acid-binding Zn ribbon protein